jgi:GxxExxY protein
MLNHRDTEAQRDSLSEAVISAAIEVHRILGPGLLESAYEQCLCYEFDQRGISYQRQVLLPIAYKGQQLDCGYRMDVVVENKIVLELKTVDAFSEIHSAQLLTYMKLSGLSTGLLLNFKVPALRHGIRRMKL